MKIKLKLVLAAILLAASLAVSHNASADGDPLPEGGGCQNQCTWRSDNNMWCCRGYMGWDGQCHYYNDTDNCWIGLP
jgi:hypothetical protein